MNELLDVTERDRLHQYETVIEHGLTTFVEVGEALAAIRDARLYRAEYATFEDYCQERWSMGRRRADQLIGAAQTMRALGTQVPILPSNEREARPLVNLPEDVRGDIWQRAVETAPNGQITPAHVRQTVDEYRAASQPVEVTIFSHKTVEYYTPPELLEAARSVLGTIDLDPASCEEAQQNVVATVYYSKADDGLARPWYGRVWLNPPYSKTDGRSNQEERPIHYWSTALWQPLADYWSIPF